MARRKAAFSIAASIAVVFGIGAAYLVTHPQVFNESFCGHQHCILSVRTLLVKYAEQNHGAFPGSPHGFADALLSLPGVGMHVHSLVSTRANAEIYKRALRSGGGIDETECSRIYIQGLRVDSEPGIVVFLDRYASPGGDHCHGLARMFAKHGREVLYVSGNVEFVPESDWISFCEMQIEQLVGAGIPRSTAEWYYSLTTDRL